MNVKEFKAHFAEFRDGIPVEGPNSAQWRKLQDIVDSLKVEEAKATTVKSPVEKA